MAYVQAEASAASNVNIANPGFSTLDGVLLGMNDRILLTRQTASSENGVWRFQATNSAMVRPATPEQFANGSALDNATIVWVKGGTERAGSVWGMDPGRLVTVDTTTFTLTRVSLAPVQARFASIRPVKGVGSGARIPVAPIGMAWQRAQGRDDGARVAPARDGSRSCLRTGATAALAHHAKAAHQGTHGGPVPFALSSRPARPARPSTRRA